MPDRIIIIGCGAAGMAAGIAAAAQGSQVTILEKNEKPGKKIYITGKGRCNLTNACEPEQFFEKVVTNRRFLYSAFYGFTNQDMMDLMEQEGCRIKVERGQRVFPVSDHASDVTKALQGRLAALGVNIRLHTEVTRLLVEDGRAAGVYAVRDGKERLYPADAVIVATGGLSYPSTGSTGDGYRLAGSAGHTVTETSPALVPIETREDVSDMMGLSLRNVEVSVRDGKKEIYREFGEMLFTHFGVSGPLILTASSYAAARIRKHPLMLYINLKPALTREQLDARILRDFAETPNRTLANALGKLLPSAIISHVVRLSGVPAGLKVNGITREQREMLLDAVQHFPLTLTKLRGYNEAIITQGGVSVKEVNPSTMESKLVRGLYFAGEVLDVDAETGGFNLQIAWSTGTLAGRSASGC